MAEEIVLRLCDGLARPMIEKVADFEIFIQAAKALTPSVKNSSQVEHLPIDYCPKLIHRGILSQSFDLIYLEGHCIGRS